MERKHEGEWKKETYGKGSSDHATWWVVTTKISGRSLESFIFIKIRPKGEASYL